MEGPAILHTEKFVMAEECLPTERAGVKLRVAAHCDSPIQNIRKLGGLFLGNEMGIGAELFSPLIGNL